MITLNNQTYRAVRLNDRRVVIVKRGGVWRLASERDTLRVLAGLRLCVLRLV